MGAFFDIPLDLPHAGTIAHRIARRIAIHGPVFSPGSGPLVRALAELGALLEPFMISGENPPEAEGRRAAEEALRLGRWIVDEIEKLGWGEDRLGQCVRNLFECLERGDEGALLSLRAGEDPNGVQRPF